MDDPPRAIQDRPAEPWASVAIDVEARPDWTLEDPQGVERLAGAIAEYFAVDLHGAVTFRFDPSGFSLAHFGETARIAIHTWPERRMATIDIWMSLRHLEGRDIALSNWLESEHHVTVMNYRLTRTAAR